MPLKLCSFFYFQCIFFLLLRLGDFYWLVFKFIDSFFVISVLLETISSEIFILFFVGFFSTLIHNFHFVLVFYYFNLLLFCWNFLSFHPISIVFVIVHWNIFRWLHWNSCQVILITNLPWSCYLLIVFLIFQLWFSWLL